MPISLFPLRIDSRNVGQRFLELEKVRESKVSAASPMG